MCWMCNPEEYKWASHADEPVNRLLDEDEYTFVVVPLHSHVRHHLLVVLKRTGDSHKCGLIDCNANDLQALAIMTAKWCSILKTMHYDTIYSGCYSDEGHMHYHLIPFSFEKDKGFKSHALQWLGCKEMVSDTRAWHKLDDAGKVARLTEIRDVVNELANTASGKTDSSG
jgi:diadenosine tetraphosphate (Ap4A) HIT family hydrolase